MSEPNHTEQRKQQEFYNLAERFRNECDASRVNILGDELGRMIFGGGSRRVD